MRVSCVRGFLPLVVVALVYAGCSAPSEPTGAPRTCDKDLDCGSRQYCTVARLCRTDCYVDADCLGPTTTAQCNTHGRCVDTVEPSDATPPAEDATKTDGAHGGAGGGGP
jgi:hypothetical protein